MIVRKVDVTSYEPAWPGMFEAEARQLKAELGKIVTAIHHIGSTAIPGMAAKPIIDILMEVSDIDLLDGYDLLMQGLGYIPKGEYGIAGRRFFIKGSEVVHSHHLHVFQQGDKNIIRHLAFRDYLKMYPTVAREYSQLKFSLAQQFPEDIDGYIAGKDAFVKRLEQKALDWQRMNVV
jgi:GrpB-like predicted nucleotidyltransferase (UPF0157 family)